VRPQGLAPFAANLEKQKRPGVAGSFVLRIA
jgi:hypothetical protein